MKNKYSRSCVRSLKTTIVRGVGNERDENIPVYAYNRVLGQAT